MQFKVTPAARALDDRLRELAALQRRLNPTQIDRGQVWVYLRASPEPGEQPTEPR